METSNMFSKTELLCRMMLYLQSSVRFSVVRWDDYSIVTVISNNCPFDPTGFTRRYDRKQRKEVNIPQPSRI